jgi:arginase
MTTTVNAIGAALGLGAQLRATAQAPIHLMRSQLQARLKARGVDLNWAALIEESPTVFEEREEHWPEVRAFVKTLNEKAQEVLSIPGETLVVGGDHAIAMGTWPGVVNHYQSHGNFGLIWIDAHMDAHTAETSPSTAMHGMPVAALLGEGKTAWESHTVYLKPEHITLIGIRSFEEGEAALLAERGVRVYDIEEVQNRGFEPVFKEALGVMNDLVPHFGVSLDLDGFDPTWAPGVGSPEPNGLVPAQVLPALQYLKNMRHFRAFELVEFNPDRDIDGKTEQLIEDILVALYAKE